MSKINHQKPRPVPTVVELVVPSYNIRRAFSIEHAERLLSLGKNNGGWVLPEDSEFVYTLKDGIKRKSNTGDSTEA